MIFTICKQCVNQKMTRANQIQPCVNFSTPYANPKISVIPKSFAKSSRDTAYFHGLITCPIFLDQSVEVTFSGEKKSLHGLHRFTPDCPPMILLYFCKNTCIYCAGFCAGFRAGFCAVALPSARSHRRCIAVASPSHRRIALQPHRIAAASHRCTKRRRLADFIRITYASGAADSLYAD